VEISSFLLHFNFHYPGVITAVKGDKYNVAYDNGDTAESLNANRIAKDKDEDEDEDNVSSEDEFKPGSDEERKTVRPLYRTRRSSSSRSTTSEESSLDSSGLRRTCRDEVTPLDGSSAKKEVSQTGSSTRKKNNEGGGDKVKVTQKSSDGDTPANIMVAVMTPGNPREYFTDTRKKGPM